MLGFRLLLGLPGGRLLPLAFGAAAAPPARLGHVMKELIRIREAAAAAAAAPPLNGGGGEAGA